MRISKLRKHLGFTLSIALAACAGDLPHESPFDVDSPLERQAKASLRATVVLEGEPDAGGVGVRLENRLRSYNFTTSNDGAVFIPGIVPGQYSLSIYARYFKPVSETVLIGLGETFDRGALTLDAARARISGLARATVVDAGVSEAVGGVSVTLRRTGSLRGVTALAPGFAFSAETTEAVFSTLSGYDGNWSLENIPAGVYEADYQREGAAGSTGEVIQITGDGNVTAGEVMLAPLTGLFKIVGQVADGVSETYTQTPNVSLELYGFNARQMRIGRSGSGAPGDCEYTSGAVTYDVVYPYVITAEGRETVCVRYIDDAGRETDNVTASIYYDASPPQLPLILVNNGAAFSTHAQGVVTLTLNATDTGSGMAGFRLANSESEVAPSAILPYEPSRVYVLADAPVDGLKPVWVSFYDKAGNYSAPISATIMLDREAPHAALSVPGGPLVPSSIVNVDLAADSDTALMQLSNDAAMTGSIWQAYQPSIVWNFLAGQGARTLYARFQDYAGNESEILSLAVTVDTSPPIIGTVNAAVISDTIVWDHLGPDVTGYTVQLYNQGMLVATTHTTEKRLTVGQMNPGYTVIAHYADGTRSNPSFSPGYDVPATLPAYLGLKLGAAENRLLANLAQAYGLGTTTSGCGQVTFVGGQASEWGGDACGQGSTVRIVNNDWGITPPPFDAALGSDPENPFADLTTPLRISGGAPGYYYQGDADPVVYLEAPTDLQWPGSEQPQMEAGQPVLNGERYNPVSGTGRNEMTLFFPLAAMLMSDDATMTTEAFTGSLTAYDPLSDSGLSLESDGSFAGIEVASAVYLNRYSQTYIGLNEIWTGTSNKNRYGIMPGAIRLPMYVNEGSASGSALTLSSTFPYCIWGNTDYVCNTYGTQVTLDVAAASLTILRTDPWGYNYGGDGFTISNAEGTRWHTVPMPHNGRSVFTWSNEVDQSAIFRPFLKRMVQTLAAPARVRGTGKPVLTQEVSDATEMQLGTDAGFTDAEWEGYQSSVTLPEGTTSIWVRYRDPAGNVTPPQEVAIAAPETAPRLDSVVLLGAAGTPNYTNEVNVTAYLMGQYSSSVRARVSTSPVFADEGWFELGTPQNTVVFRDPLTGEQAGGKLERDQQFVTLPLTLPNAPGSYTYYFWVADASHNFSAMKAGTVIFDDSEPDAEFSIKPGGQGEIMFQARWTVTKTPLIPSLAAVAPAAATTYTLPFMVPFLDTESDQLRFPEGPACFSIGYLEACPLARMPFKPTRSISVLTDRVVLVWQGEGEYGVPVTAAATVFRDGVVRLSYWKTGARVPMYGHVDTVETPFADWHFALAQGSIEYTPNRGDMQFLLVSQNGVKMKIRHRADDVDVHGSDYSIPSPWYAWPTTEAGFLRFTGTAYSMAGAAGRVTVREVSLREYEYDDLTVSNIHTVPLSDGRFWLSLDLGDRLTSRLRVDGLDTGVSPVIAGSPRETLNAQEAYWPDPQVQRGSQTYVWNQGRLAFGRFEPALQFHKVATVSGAGAPMTIDFENRLAYGAEGSVWDIANPYAPAPLRAFGGSYPYTRGSTARLGSTLWTRSGIWNVSNPEAPVKVGNVHSSRSYFATYAGYVYEAVDSNLRVYDASAAEIASGNIGYYIDGPLTAVGDMLYTSNGNDLIRIDLSDPLNPTSELAGTGVDGYSMTLNAGSWLAKWEPFAASGALRIVADSGFSFIRPYALSVNNTPGELMASSARQLVASGPWLYGIGSDRFTVAHVGASLPGAVRQVFVAPDSWSLPVAADSRYFYTCLDTQLTVYTHDWTLVTSRSVSYCDNLRVKYPYVSTGGEVFRFSGTTLLAAPVEFCSLESWGNNCSTGYPVGDAFSSNAKFYVSPDQPIALSEDCEPMLAAGDVLYCRSWDDNALKGTTASAMRYSGIVTSPDPLPLVTLISDANIQSGGGEYFATYDKTYRVRALNVAEMVHPEPLRFFEPSLASGSGGRLYRADDGGLTLVGAMGDSQPVAVSPDGTLLGTNNGLVKATRWGPATPRLRFVANDITGATSIVASHGYVYVGTEKGILRIDSPVRAAVSYPRSDVVMRHTPGTWTYLNRKLQAVDRIAHAPGATVSDLCGTLLKRRWQDLENVGLPPIWDVCEVDQNVPADAVFEGELTGDWLAFGGFSQLNIGNVTGLVVGRTGRVYAAVNDGAASGVYVFDPDDTSLVVTDAISTAGNGVVALAVDEDTVYFATEANDIQAYRFTTGSHVFEWSLGLQVTAIEAAFGELLIRDGADNIQKLNRDDGNVLGWCSNGGGDFVLTTQRWGGEEHTLVVIAGSGWLHITDVDTCAQIGVMPAPLQWPAVESLSLQDGFLIAGYGAHGVWLTPLRDFSQQAMNTGFVGRQPAEKAVILGNMVYTISANGALQIFQMH